MVKIINSTQLATFVKKVVDNNIKSIKTTVAANSAYVECRFDKPLDEENFSNEFSESLKKVIDLLISSDYFSMTYPLEGKHSLSVLFTYSRYVEVR